VPNEDALTESQWIWVQCHLFLDDGVLACPGCDALGIGAYCHACGGRLVPAAVACPQCHLPGGGTYCTACGALLRNPITEALAAQTFDWDAWRQSLQPFLGGLSPQEEALLAHDMGMGLSNG
jgi:hypothetical protein